MVSVRQSFNCVVVRDHSLTGQRMAPHTPQESPQVKTMCFRIGWCRLYAPMVPLASHPCVRWWNTEEITLKLTRLYLHSLKGGFTHQKPSISVRAGCVWMVGAWEAYGCVIAKDYSFPEEKNSLSRSPRKVSGQDQVHWSRLDTSLRSRGSSCPAPVRTLVEH